MAQIIKHRRGSIGALKDVTANIGELVIATGSIGDLNAPVVFVGSSEIAGGYKPVSKIYQGSAVPSVAGYGSIMDGTPFYSTDSKTLYILDHTTNVTMDFSGNLEGKTISGVTINNLTGSKASFDTYVSASALNVTGDTQMKGSVTVDGSTTINNNLTVTGTTSVSGITNLGSSLNVTGETTLYSATTINDKLTVTGRTNANGGLNVTGSVNISGITSMTGALYLNDSSTDFSIVGNGFSQTYFNGNGAFVLNPGYGGVEIIGTNAGLKNNGKTYLNDNLYVGGETYLTGSVHIYGDTVNVTGSMKVNGDVTIEQDLYVSGNIYQTGSFYTQGNIVLSGSINIGNSLTGDTINFGGEVNSNILPTTGATYNLGSTGQTWNEVHAEYYYGDGSHLTNISLTGITGLQLDKITSGYATASISEANGLSVNVGASISGSFSVTGDTFLTGTIYIGDNTASQIYNDGALYVQDNNNGVTIQSDNYAELQTSNAWIWVEGNDAYVEGGNYTKISTISGNVDISSYDGSQLRLNYDGGEGNIRMGNGDNSVQIYSHTYINNDKTLYVNRMWDNSDNSNYLELYGYGTNDNYWWESGSGADTTLNNNWGGAHTNILNTNNGNVNVDATNGSVNIHSSNGTNITGSLIVSDGSGVFNSSLVVNNSDLTLDGGSNIHMNDGAHLYFDSCIDMYLDGSDNFIFYNDCNSFEFQNNVQFNDNINVNTSLYVQNNAYLSSSLYVANELKVTGSVYFESSVSLENNNTLYTNNIGGYDGGDLNIGADGAVYIFSDNNRWIELSTQNAEGGTNFSYVNNDGVSFTTYDVTSGLTHKVLLDNTGSLILENVSLSLTGSLNVSGSLDIQGVTHIHNDLYVSGNLSILGSGSVVHISSSQVDLGTNIINLNTYAPFERFAGISVYDSGSSAGVTGSLLWDSTNNVWIYANPSGSNYASARFIAGPINTGSLGDEMGLSNGHFPIATGDDHISDSLLTYLGTELALNTNKFTVDSDSGAMMIDGNFTIHGVGSTDNGTYSSYIVFKNDQDELGFVDTTDTENVTDRLLGYNATTGLLEFSSLIDGGQY